MAPEVLPFASWFDLNDNPRVDIKEQTGAGKLSSAVSMAAQAVAQWNWHSRFRGVVFTRYATGRDTITGSSSYAIAKRPISMASDIASLHGEWRPPSLNQIATAMDVYSTRIFKNRPYIQILPYDGAGGFKARTRSTKLSKYIDATFDETKFWETMYLLGRDCMEQGTAVVKIHEDQHRKGRIAITRVLKDEILIADDEAIYGPVPSMIQVVFYNRRDLLARYGKTAALRALIARAPSVFPGFCSGLDLSYKNVVPVYEAWSKPFKGENGQPGTPGRHCIVFSGHVILDEEWKKQYFPFEYLKFAPLTNSPWAQGLVEQCLGSQVSLDEQEAVIDECHARCARTMILVESGSNVSEEQIPGLPGVVINYTQTAPQQIAPPILPPEAYQLRDTRKAEVLMRAGISQNATAGVTPEGLKAAVAIMANSNIEDSRHADLDERCEDFVCAVGLQVLALATDLKPVVKTAGRRGRTIKWDEAKLSYDPEDLTSSEFNAEPFRLSRFSKTIAAREQQVQDWLDSGKITPKVAMRVGLIPDTEALGDESTVELDLIEELLDEVVEKGKFLPPPAPFVDPKMALDMARKRWAKELLYGDTPAASFRALFQFMEALKDFIQASAPPAPAAPMPGAPGSPPPGAQPGQPASPPVQAAA